jgi:hypothetical protein
MSSASSGEADAEGAGPAFVFDVSLPHAKKKRRHAARRGGRRRIEARSFARRLSARLPERVNG